MVAVALLDLAEMGMLTQIFTYEEMLFFLPSLCRCSQQLVRLQQKQWLPRTAAWELQKTLRRVRHQYDGFNGDRALRCMELFVRLLHELHATHVVQFSTSDKQENRCLALAAILLPESRAPTCINFVSVRTIKGWLVGHMRKTLFPGTFWVHAGCGCVRAVPACGVRRCGVGARRESR
jgi:hypothetical protein